MNDTQNIQYTRKGIELISLLIESGKRIFTAQEAQPFASKVGISSKYFYRVLSILRKGGWIISLKRGIYTFGKAFGTVPLHEFEIAMVLTSPSIISHWTALNYHGLTEQTPRMVYILTTAGQSVPRTRHGQFGVCKILGVEYSFIRIKKERLFGVQKIWKGDAQISITDPERTLLDGLMRPQYCGGFNEVFHAFENSLERIDVDKLISYALQFDKSNSKRLGWILSKLGFSDESLTQLKQVKVQSYTKLDPSQPAKGKCNRNWRIQENIYFKL